jgi:hypothetical protein
VVVRLLPLPESVRTLLTAHFETCDVGLSYYWAKAEGKHSDYPAAVIVLLPDDLLPKIARPLVAVLQMMGEITQWHLYGNLRGGSEIECNDWVGCPEDDESSSTWTSFYQGLGFSFSPYLEVVFPYEVADPSFWEKNSGEIKPVTETCR